MVPVFQVYFLALVSQGGGSVHGIKPWSSRLRLWAADSGADQAGLPRPRCPPHIGGGVIFEMIPRPPYTHTQIHKLVCYAGSESAGRCKTISRSLLRFAQGFLGKRKKKKTNFQIQSGWSLHSLLGALGTIRLRFPEARILPILGGRVRQSEFPPGQQGALLEAEGGPHGGLWDRTIGESMHMIAHVCVPVPPCTCQ